MHNNCIPGCQRPSSASSLIQTLSALMNLMSVSASSSVVCLCMLSAGRTKQQAWQFHESVRDKDKPGATCCVHYGIVWMQKECLMKHKAPLKLVKEMEGGIPVSGQSDSDSSLTSCSCDF